MKVLLIDDHGLFRHGLELLLKSRPDFNHVLHASDGGEALRLQSLHSDIDLVLLDYNLGEDFGLDVLARLKSRDPSLPITIVSGREDPQIILSALGSGASGFIFKHSEPDDLLAAIDMILQGGIYVPPSIIRNTSSPNATSGSDTYNDQVRHLTETARRVVREKNLDLRAQAEVECEMTSAFNHLLAELQEERSRLETLAFNDDLTGLANRRLFMERLDQALRGARRNKTKIALAYVDLDHFKEINDNLGHPAGDTLLVEIAHRLADSVREVDTVARIGGDEFTMILVDVDPDNGLDAFIERLHNTLRQTVELSNGVTCRPSASLGVAISDGSDSIAELMQRADEILYQVKNQGRDNYGISRSQEE